MNVNELYYVNYNGIEYTLVGVLLDDEDDQLLLDNLSYHNLLFGDVQLARTLEPFDTSDKRYIDNQIVFYFDNNICQKYINGNLSEKQFLNIVENTILSW